MKLKSPTIKQFIEKQIELYGYPQVVSIEIIQNANMKMITGNPFDNNTKCIELNNSMSIFIEPEWNSEEECLQLKIEDQYDDYIVIAKQTIKKQDYIKAIEPNYLELLKSKGNINCV